jgi:uncharacterized protein YlbG (UPF0298 family)
MDIKEKLDSGSFKFKIFAQGFLELVYQDDVVPLRNAQKAGLDALEEKELTIAMATVTSYSRQLREFGLVTTRKNKRNYQVVLTDNEHLLETIEEFVNSDIERKQTEKRDISDLKFPCVITKEKPMPYAQYRRYTAAVFAGQAKMVFKLVNND